MSPLLSRRLLSAQSDERLVALARAGHERAFEALVERYRKPLLRYCQRLLLPESRADDALQQAWVSAWQALSRGAQVQEPRAWLYRIVHNEAVSALRRSGYDYRQLHDSLSGATSPAEDLERRIAVREALAGLASLPDIQREVLLRTAVEGQSHEEVASALGLSDGAVRGLIYRARTKMRAAATAVTPSPLAVWAASAGKVGLATGRAAEALGLGSLSASGAMVKAGVVALTAGGLVTGGVFIQSHGHRARPGRAAVAPDRSGRDSVALGRTQARARPPDSGATRGLTDRSGAGGRRRHRRTGRATDRSRRFERRRGAGPTSADRGSTTIAPARAPGVLDQTGTGTGRGSDHSNEGAGGGRDGGGSTTGGSSGGPGPDHVPSGGGLTSGGSGSGSGGGGSGGGDGAGAGTSSGGSGPSPTSIADGGGSTTSGGSGGGSHGGSGGGSGSDSISGSSGSSGSGSPRTDGSGSSGSGSSTPGY